MRNKKKAALELTPVHIAESFSSRRSDFAPEVLNINADSVKKISVIYIGDARSKIHGSLADQMVHLPNDKGVYVRSTFSVLLNSCEVYIIPCRSFGTLNSNKELLEVYSNEIEKDSQIDSHCDCQLFH